jgi:Fur family ferric uptake transcriptional regulator
MVQSSEKFIRILRSAGLKATPIRLAMMDLFSRQHALLSVEEVHLGLNKSGANLVTIYRSVKSFEEAGILISTELGDGVVRYEFRPGLSELNAHHHHHVVCRVCKKIESFESCQIERSPTEVRALGYTDLDHRLDFFGICPTCQKAA